MRKIKQPSTEFRGPLGVVVTLSSFEFDELFDPAQNERPKVKRRQATFLPGVNPAWEARQLARRQASVPHKHRKPAVEVLEDGTILEHLGYDIS